MNKQKYKARLAKDINGATHPLFPAQKEAIVETRVCPTSKDIFYILYVDNHSRFVDAGDVHLLEEMK